MVRYGFVALIIAIMAIGCGQQQGTVSYDDQIDVAKSADDAIHNLDWAAYATFVHPDELATFREMLAPHIERRLTGRDTTNLTDTISFLGINFAVADLKNPSNEAFFATVISGVFASAPDLQISFQGINSNYVGAVGEADSLVYVVVHSKMTIQSREIDEMIVTTLSKYEGDWKVQFSTQVQGIIFMLQQGLQQMGQPMGQRRP